MAAGLCRGQIKAGAPANDERTAKYIRPLRIEKELGDGAHFHGMMFRKTYEPYLPKNW